MNKHIVKNKISRLCMEYGISKPANWTYEEVKKVSDIINNTCPLCKKYKWWWIDIICSCEVSRLKLNF